uniref:Uncharacterized protein n=1 Tax=Panagrolaimus sp. ES5 TaxID=591445 RepID=A0AC34FPL7_9BILA
MFFKSLFSFCIFLLSILLIKECHSQIYYHPGTGMYHNYGPSAQHHFNYGYSNPYHYYQGQQQQYNHPYYQQYYQQQAAASGHAPYHYASGQHSAAPHVNPTNIAYHHDEGNHGQGVPGLATFWLSCSSHNCQGRKK